MSRSKFESIINNYGLPLHDGDLDIIWANIEPNGPNMSYSDFVRFITMETIDPNKGAKRTPSTARPSPPPQPTYPDEIPPDNYSTRPTSNSSQRQMKTSSNNSFSGRGAPMPSSQPPSSGNSLFQILLDYKQQIGNSLLNIDPSFSGFVTGREFEDIIQRIALVNSSEIQRLVSIYDPSNSGFFNYFTLLSDICNQANEQPPPPRSSYAAPPRSTNPQYDDYSSPPRRGGRPQPPSYDDYTSPRSGPANPTYDDYDIPGRNQHDNYPNPNPRAPPTYDEYGPPSTTPNSSSNPTYDDYPPQTPSPTSPSPSSRVDEIIEKIASRMDNVYDSSQTCYQKWRSYSQVLGPQEFVSGARKDFQIDLTVDEASAVIARYSTKGFLSMGEFLKMVGAGSDIIREQRKAQAAVALSEEEKVLQHVARQAKNKDWRPVFEQCESVERMVQSLRTINVYVMLNDLRPCFNKWGREGVINKIQAFVDSM